MVPICRPLPEQFSLVFLQWGGSGGGNVANQTFSTVIESFEVVVNPGGVTEPIVVTTAATDLTAISFSANGEVTDTGNEPPNVTIYYGATDGGTDPLSWDSMIESGPQTGVFAATIVGLTPNASYFYRAQATNSAGTVWADSTESVTTLSPSTPAVSVLPGSSDGAGSLTMNGEVTDSGMKNRRLPSSTERAMVALIQERGMKFFL